VFTLFIFAASVSGDVAGLSFVGASQLELHPSSIQVQIQTGLVVLSQAKLSSEVPVTSTVMVTGSSARGNTGNVVTTCAFAEAKINNSNTAAKKDFINKAYLNK
jgi:hypothetical protein